MSQGPKLLTLGLELLLEVGYLGGNSIAVQINLGAFIDRGEAGAFLLTLFVLVGIQSRSHRAGRAIARTMVALMVPVYLVCLFLVYRG